VEADGDIFGLVAALNDAVEYVSVPLASFVTFANADPDVPDEMA
jgi:hypothetical protein